MSDELLRGFCLGVTAMILLNVLLNIVLWRWANKYLL